MTVDYDEGRRLLKRANEADVAYEAAEEMDDVRATGTVFRQTQKALMDFLERHAEALLNPDPWRPIEEAPKDGRIVDLWVKDYADGWFRIPDCKWGIPWPGEEACWLENKPHPDALHDWEWQPIDFEPTHFRELKGPGHV